MGYNSRLSGRLEINPPLPWSQYKGSRFSAARTPHDLEATVQFEELVESTDTDEGTVTTWRAVAVVPHFEDPSKIYTLTEDLQAIAAAFPDRLFAGYLVRDGEETGDLERYWITDGEVRSEKARLTWPDGSIVDLP